MIRVVVGSAGVKHAQGDSADVIALRIGVAFGAASKIIEGPVQISFPRQAVQVIIFQCRPQAVTTE